MKYSFQEKLVNKKSSLMWNNRIEVPLDICQKLITSDKRVVIELNNLISFQCALTSDGNGNYYVIVNKENAKKAKLSIGQIVDVCISKDNSKYGIALPLEMEELLEQDEHGSRLFHQLTPGRQRSLLYIIGKPKSEEIRIRKAITVLDYLVSVNGKLDFKELQIALKNSNRKF